MGLHDGRVGHRGFRIEVLAGQEAHDPVPDPAPGIAPAHVAGGLVVAVPRWHVPPAASGPQNVTYAVQRLLQVGSFPPAHLWQEGFDHFDVLVGQFAYARHGGFSFASAGTLASRVRCAREAPPVLRPENQTRRRMSRKFRGARRLFGGRLRPSGAPESATGADSDRRCRGRLSFEIK